MTKNSRSWLLTLLALICLAAGIGMLLASLLPGLHDWSRLSSPDPVQAIALLFVGLGLGLLHLARHERRAALKKPTAASQPWLARPEWAGNRIRSQQNLEMRVAWIFALIWNLVAIPTAIEVVPKALERNHLALLVLLFPLLGLILLRWAIKTTLSARRFGDVCLALDPYPGAVGGHFGASLLLPVTASSARHFAVTLNCINFYEVESGGERESRERLVWQTEGIANTHPHAKGMRLSFRFSIPADLPVSEEPGKDYHGWRLDIQSRNPDLEFARRFDVPVFATGEKASTLHQDADTHPQMQEIHAVQIEDVCDIERLPDGLRLHFPIARNWRTSLSWLAFGLAFAGFGALSRALGAPLLFLIAFGAIGLAITLASLFSLASSLRVQLDRRGLQTEQRLCGLLLARRQANARDITRLQLQERYSMQSGGKHHKVYRITAALTNGKRVTLARGLRGQGTAQHLLAMISAQSGYPAG